MTRISDVSSVANGSALAAQPRPFCSRRPQITFNFNAFFAIAGCRRRLIQTVLGNEASLMLHQEPDPQAASRAVKDYLATLDEAAFGAATVVEPKFVSPSDPAARWTGAHKGPAFFAYADKYLIDVRCGVIIDVEASRAVRQAEVGAARTMLERTEERFGLKPQRLAADSAYGSAPMLNWLVEDKQITPHIPVIDKSKRHDGYLLA